MEDVYPDNLFGTIKLISKISGLWFPNKKKNYGLWVRCWLHTILCMWCQMWFSTAEIYALQYTYTNKKILLQHIGRLLFHVNAGIKACFFYWYRKHIIEAMKVIEKEEFRYRAINDFKPGTYFQNTKRFVTRVNWGCFLVATITPTLYFYGSLASNLRHQGGFFVENSTCYDYLPYFSHPPFYAKTATSCGIGIAYQFCSLLLMDWFVGTCDGLVSTFLIYIMAHTVVVRDAFYTIRERCVQELRLVHKKELNDNQLEDEVNQRMDKEIIKCTIHLKAIISVAETTEVVFNFIALCQTLNTLFTLVSCLFLLSTVPILSTTFLSQLSYTLGLIYQLSLFCWFGNEATITSLEIPDYLYRCDWVNASSKFKKIMLINMIRMMRPLSFTAGKFANLTLATLVGIVRGSYSYFAVLKNMEAA